MHCGGSDRKKDAKKGAVKRPSTKLGYALDSAGMA